MDQALSAVIIAVITGAFSVLTLIIQKRQDKVIKKIDILKSSHYAGDISGTDVYNASDKLKEKFEKVSEEIKTLTKEYEMLIELTAQIQEELKVVQVRKS